MRNFAAVSLLIASVLSSSLPRTARADTDLTGRALLQYGVAFPQAPLSNLIDSGKVYRINLFGGAKLGAVRWISAVGLGLDFFYEDFQTKNLGAGSFYHRYVWDMFALPIGIGWFVFTPSVNWVVTHTKMVRFGVDSASIRPAFVADLGVRVPVAGPLLLRFDGRYEYVVPDRQPSLTSAETVNLTGSFWSVLGGLEFIF